MTRSTRATMIQNEAERMWAAAYPKRNPNTLTAVRQVAALFPAAARALMAAGKIPASHEVA